jgi:hypothetical protein
MITTRDLEKAAGFLEGEGCFFYGDRTPTVSANQVAAGPLEYLRSLFGGKIYRTAAKGNKQAFGQWRICGPQAAGLMITLYGLMLSDRRRGQIIKALKGWFATELCPTCRMRTKKSLTSRECSRCRGFRLHALMRDRKGWAR